LGVRIQGDETAEKENEESKRRKCQPKASKQTFIEKID
jgi:hypothetical protein